MTTTRTMRPVEGIWTPWAAVLCYRDHGASGPVTAQDVANNDGAVTPGEDEGVTPCDTCGRPVVVRGDVAAEHNMVLQLRTAGYAAHMDQTGGMCSAAQVDLPDGAYLLIVDAVNAVQTYGTHFGVFRFDAEDNSDEEDPGFDNYEVPAADVPGLVARYVAESGVTA